ncbi:hypothetical protein GC207_14470 [bacterium]|nr:hypothetical protein [bacterium]
MNAVYFDPRASDAERRRLLFQGHLLKFSPTKASLELCQFARQLSEEAFAPHDPLRAQYEMSPAEYSAILAKLKPAFIHHPRCKELIRDLFVELNCDLDLTFFDVPRLRTSTSDNYLTSGLAYAFHPHRDTWYSAPHCQINWWLPVYDVVPENCLAFHPPYWNKPIKNGSRDYDYYRWNRESRAAAATQVGKDTRKQPGPEESIDLDPQLRLVGEVGSIILFSAAHLHSSVPNTSGYTRFSIDFRTVHGDDVRDCVGAHNIDSACTGTNLRDFLRGSDFSRLPEEWVQPYDTTPPPEDAVLVYQPTTTAK